MLVVIHLHWPRLEELEHLLDHRVGRQGIWLAAPRAAAIRQHVSTSGERSYLTFTGRWINRWRACSIFARASGVPHSSAIELYPGLAAMTRTSGPSTPTGSTWLSCHPRPAPTFLTRSGQTFRAVVEIQRRQVVARRDGLDDTGRRRPVCAGAMSRRQRRRQCCRSASPERRAVDRRFGGRREPATMARRRQPAAARSGRARRTLAEGSTAGCSGNSGPAISPERWLRER